MAAFQWWAAWLIPALVLNTVATVLAVCALALLPDDVSPTLTAYVGTLVGASALVWVLLLTLGSYVLHQARTRTVPVGAVWVLFTAGTATLTVAALFGVLALVVLQTDLDATLLTPRNLVAAAVPFTAVPWLLLILGLMCRPAPASAGGWICTPPLGAGVSKLA